MSAMKEIYLDSSYSPEERAMDLVSRMTPDEKAAQLRSIPIVEAKVCRGKVMIKELEGALKNGIGSFQLPGRNFCPSDSAAVINRLQELVMSESRFSIPALIQEECLSGHVAKGASMFPKPIGLAATFDPELVRAVYQAIGSEAAARGGNQAFTPVLDLGRDLRWGRLEETFGEDVYLVSEMGYAAVTGLQGGEDGVKNGFLAASVKHFAGYGQCDGGRNFAPCHVTERMLFDEILPPFKRAVMGGKARGVMPSHSDVDGVPCHASNRLLKKILREEWGFDGVVISDYYDISRLESVHHVADCRREAAAAALRAGVDMDLPDGKSYELLPEICRSDVELAACLDRAVVRVLRMKFELGLFEHPFVDPERAKTLVRCEKHRKLAYRAAVESLVLLKNEGGILPVSASGPLKIAVIGPCAHPVHFSYYSTSPAEGVSILRGVQTMAESLGAEVYYEKGCGLTKQEFTMDTEVDATMLEEPEPYTLEEEEEGIERAVRLAEACDIVVACVGGSASTSREAIFKNNSSGDNDTLELAGQQKELLRRLNKTGKRLIAVSVGGKPYSSAELHELPLAVIQCFYAGQETGSAVAAVLFGMDSPSGRLPVTVPYNVGQMPVYYSQRASGLMKGYLLGAKRARYPFGYGLGYTTFSIFGVTAGSGRLLPDGKIIVIAWIQNTGGSVGVGVAQLYIRDKKASVTRPDMELKGFLRTELKPGEKRRLEFEVTEEMLRFTRLDGTYGSEPGEFEAMVGVNAWEYASCIFTLEEKRNGKI